MHIKISDLPQHLQNALNALGYRRADISVEGKDKVTLLDCGSDGRRAFVCIVNLATGERQTTRGSWGGPNMFSPKNSVDNDQNYYPIPKNGAVIKGLEGGQVYANVYVAPETIAPMLPAKPEVTDDEQSILYAYSALKSGPYRKEQIDRVKNSAQVIDGMVTKGWLKRNAAGSVQITTDGKNLVRK